MSNETTLLYVWIKSLTKIYCILKSCDKISIDYFTEDNFIFQFFLAHFNLNCIDYRIDLRLKEILHIMKDNLKKYLDSYGYNSVNLINEVFKNYHLRENKMKIWKMIFTITFLDDFSLLCKRFIQNSEKYFNDKSFYNHDHETSILKYNQNIPKKLTIRSMIKSPILLKLSLHISNEILTECQVGYTDIENLIQINFIEALNESKSEEVYNINVNSYINEKSHLNDNNSNNISFNNYKSEIFREDTHNDNTNHDLSNNDISIYDYNPINGNNYETAQSDFSKDENENYFKKTRNLVKKFVNNGINEKSKFKITENNHSDISGYDEKSINISQDFVKNDNFETNLKKLSDKCEKCESYINKIEELEKLLNEEKSLCINLTISLSKYEEDKNDLVKYNAIILNEKNTISTNNKNLEKRINMLSMVEKQKSEKEREIITLNEKLEYQNNLMSKMQEKIYKQEDEIQLLSEYKIRLKINQIENIKIKRELDLSQNEINELKIDLENSQNCYYKLKKNLDKIFILKETVEFFTIKANKYNKFSIFLSRNDNDVNRSSYDVLPSMASKIENDIHTNTFHINGNCEIINYNENANIFNETNYQQFLGMQSCFSQKSEIIIQLKKKLNEYFIILSKKDNRLKDLESQLSSAKAIFKKRERMIRTLHNSVAEKTELLKTNHSILKWTYYLISIVIFCLLINKTF